MKHQNVYEQTQCPDCRAGAWCSKYNKKFRVRKYVLACIDLYIKDGGFTYDVNQAKKYNSKAEAKKDQVSGWSIHEVL